MEFVEEAFKHCKAIAANGAGVTFLEKTRIGAAMDEEDSAVIAAADIPAKKTAGVLSRLYDNIAIGSGRRRRYPRASKRFE